MRERLFNAGQEISGWGSSQRRSVLAGASPPLAEAAVPIAVPNPRQVRDFAKATGTWDKTDARVLAHFAEAVRPAVRPLPSAQALDLTL